MKVIKQTLSILLAAAVLVSMAACGASGPEDLDITGAAETAAAEPSSAGSTKGTPSGGTDGQVIGVDEKTPDISAFVGLWKYDSVPFYVSINEKFEWTAVNMYGEDTGIGTVIPAEDEIQLYSGDNLIASYRKIVGGLTDSSGNTLTATDELVLLPAPEDPLTQTAEFPGPYDGVTVSYPVTMSAHPHPSVSNSLSFNAVMEDGTDDYYSNILIAFMPISGYDPYMSQGTATATPYMKEMLDTFATNVYGDKLLQCFGTDFRDGGNYYSMTGYLWLDSSIFEGELSQPVRGCMEVRYYGPIGYALVSMTLAMEGRIKNYYDICNAMLGTLNFATDWSTAPKPVPEHPAKNEQEVQGSDSGDYGTPYYWYDEDGDVWYWNGYEDEFIGFGDDYYIDDDGNYYESNDYGWDPEDYDYYEDYDPWSDPGDTWDEWSDYDDGWDEWYDYDDDWDW